MVMIGVGLDFGAHERANMSDLYILDENKNPVMVEDTVEWSKQRIEAGSRTVKTEYVGKIHISTVFLGMDHGWGEGAPVLFETMVFGECDMDCEQDRCCTWDEALEMHDAMVRKVKLSLGKI